MTALLACLLTLTSIFGMLSKPIRDWIPELPALQRWIIPVERPRQLGYIEMETAWKESKCRVGAERSEAKRLTGPGAEGRDYGHPAGQHAGFSVLPVNTTAH